jgi:hypothetical protein
MTEPSDGRPTYDEDTDDLDGFEELEFDDEDFELEDSWEIDETNYDKPYYMEDE